jgi:Family of unknown function (DUF5681)
MSNGGVKARYRVGYGKPPIHSRYKKGQCGNAGGRPRKRSTLAEILAEELRSKIPITEGDKRAKVEKIRVVFKQAIKKAIAAGDFRPLNTVMKILSSLERLYALRPKERALLEEIDLDKLSDKELSELFMRTVKEP